MPTDWNTLNNRVSEAILRTGNLADMLAELGCDPPPDMGRSMRMPCPLHGGRRRSLQVGVDGAVLPIYWRCHSNGCHEEWKPSLLGLVRGLLSMEHGKPVHPWVAARFMQQFRTGP